MIDLRKPLPTPPAIVEIPDSPVLKTYTFHTWSPVLKKRFTQSGQFASDADFMPMPSTRVTGGSFPSNKPTTQKTPP